MVTLQQKNLVAVLLRHGLSLREAGKQLCVAHTTVLRWKRDRCTSLVRQRRAKKAVVDRAKAAVVRKMLALRTRRGDLLCHSLRRMSRLAEAMGTPIGSRSSVARLLHKMGLKSVGRPRNVLRKPSDAMARIAFARRELRLSARERHQTLFSDEKIFVADVETSRRQWVRPGETPVPLRKQRWCPRVHVWGVIGRGARFICLVEGVQTAEGYQRTCLRPALPLLRGRRFQQDGARSHTARTTMAYLRRQGIDVVPNWPPRSPDLSPIELVWGILSHQVAKRGPQTAEELQQFVIDEFHAIPEATIERLLQHYSEALGKVEGDEGL